MTVEVGSARTREPPGPANAATPVPLASGTAADALSSVPLAGAVAAPAAAFATPAASYVAVGAAATGGDADAGSSAGAQPHGADLRCRTQALATLPESARLLAAAALGAAMALAGWAWQAAGDPAAALGPLAACTGAALAAFSGSVWLTGASLPRRRKQTRSRRYGASARAPFGSSPAAAAPPSRASSPALARFAAIAVPLILIAATPWLARGGMGPGESTLLAGLVVALASLATALLAPNRPLAWVAAALPLSPALQAQWPAAATGSSAAGSGGAYAMVVTSLALMLVAFDLHRRWRRSALALIELEDRAAAFAAARDAAVRADQEKSRFLAIASHDLRQPVHAIGLFAATLDKRLAGSAEEPLVRNLNRAIDGLDRSFNIMLDISRLDAGAVEPRFRQFPLRDLFRRLHMHFAGQAEQLGLALRFSPGGKSVSSDPQLLERVLGNLVQNAIKYTERGGVVVVARSTETATHVEIWDTGVGIRAADLPKVFDEFYQVGRGERVRVQGLGMGLAIVKRLVRLMGHQLTVSSRPGRGTMFRLSIALGGLPYIQEVTAAADTLPMPVLQARTVLVLDDEEPIREGLCLLLREWGYDAVSAGSIAEAEAAVDRLEAPPDLMLSDLHLGDGEDGRDGIHAIELVRRRCGGELAAMLITGDTSHAEIRRATESGHPVLFKPVQPRKLYEALRGLGS